MAQAAKEKAVTNSDKIDGRDREEASASCAQKAIQSSEVGWALARVAIREKDETGSKKQELRLHSGYSYIKVFLAPGTFGTTPQKWHLTYSSQASCAKPHG